VGLLQVIESGMQLKTPTASSDIYASEYFMAGKYNCIE
jgi:hypothetical protein